MKKNQIIKCINCFSLFLVLAVFFLSYSCKSLIVYEEEFSTWEQKKAALTLELQAYETDFEKTNHLRRFVAGFVDIGSHSISCDVFNIPAHEINVQDHYSYFVNDQMTVVCGGAAFFLKSVYEEFNYESYTYDVGGNNVTHLFCLVKITDQGEKKLIIQDPYFDHTVISRDSFPMDFSTIIHLLRTKESDSILYLKDYSVGNTLVNNRVSAWSHWQLDKKKEYSVSKSKNEEVPFLFRQTRSIDTYMDGNIKSNCCSFLTQNGYPCDLKYLFLFPLSHNEQWIIDFVDKIQ